MVLLWSFIQKIQNKQISGESHCHIHPNLITLRVLDILRMISMIFRYLLLLTVQKIMLLLLPPVAILYYKLVTYCYYIFLLTFYTGA
jgi:hypothetical protein